MNVASPSPDPSVDRSPGDVRARAYAAGARVARDRIAREEPLDAEALGSVEAADIVVIPGAYDHVEQVLGALEMPFTVADPQLLGQLELRPEQLLVVNCPGDMDSRTLAHVRAFVEGGGSLFTTDWALERVLQAGFPGTVAFNGHATRDDVVPIQVIEHDNPFLRGVMDGEDEPQWWLEGSSHPIRVVDPERVHVLIRSHELGTRYGEEAVAVVFRWGEGEVFHMISHYYLQRTEFRTPRHAASGASYFAEKGMAVPSSLDLVGVQLGDVEAAAGSSRLFANVIARKKRGGIRVDRPAGHRREDGHA